MEIKQGSYIWKIYTYIKKIYAYTKKIYAYTRSIENLYIKFILTIIAIALWVNACKTVHVRVLGYVDTYEENTLDVRVSGEVDARVSGEVDTYEQNALDVDVSGRIYTW